MSESLWKHLDDFESQPLLSWFSSGDIAGQIRIVLTTGASLEQVLIRYSGTTSLAMATACILVVVESLKENRECPPYNCLGLLMAKLRYKQRYNVITTLLSAVSYMRVSPRTDSEMQAVKELCLSGIVFAENELTPTREGIQSALDVLERIEAVKEVAFSTGSGVTIGEELDVLLQRLKVLATLI